jgi:four helix bundle protein
MNLVKSVYKETKNFPVEERYGLQTQIRRAAVSIPSNIAEGHARRSTKEFLQFISIARGSMAELETQLILAKDLGFLEAPMLTKFMDELNALGKMLRGLEKALSLSLAPRPSPLAPPL